MKEEIRTGVESSVWVIKLQEADSCFDLFLEKNLKNAVFDCLL